MSAVVLGALIPSSPEPEREHLDATSPGTQNHRWMECLQTGTMNFMLFVLCILLQLIRQPCIG